MDRVRLEARRASRRRTRPVRGEKLARRRAVTVEIDFQRRLLGSGERPREVAGAMKEIVYAARKRRTVRDRRSDLGSNSNMGRSPTIRAPRVLHKPSRWSLWRACLMATAGWEALVAT